MSITSGENPTTRLSTAAVVHVVQPRFEAPATKNFSTFTLPPAGVAEKAVTVSMARTAAFVIGIRRDHVSSPVLRYFTHVYAIIASSFWLFVSSATTTGLFA